MATSLPAWDLKQEHELGTVTTIPFGSRTTVSGCAGIPVFNLTYQPYITALWQHMCMIQQVECRIFCSTLTQVNIQSSLGFWAQSILQKLLIWSKLIKWKLAFHYFLHIKLQFLPKVKKFHQNIWSSPYCYLRMNIILWMINCCI
jgi:hypothetical protein